MADRVSIWTEPEKAKATMSITLTADITASKATPAARDRKAG
jgi:hypothetical protein